MAGASPVAAVDGVGAGAAAAVRPSARRRWALMLAAVAPGLVVMLADSDAGSVITAAQSGATWGYRMVLPQILLIPVLFVIQDLTVRLGAGTGLGYTALIRERFGRPWAGIAAGALGISALGALVTEFAAVAGVGELFGLSRWLTVPVAVAFLVSVTLAGSQRRVEAAGLALGLAELAFLPAMLASHPAARSLTAGLASAPLGSDSYRYLLAANVGAVVMPWMIAYQQDSVAAGRRRARPASRPRAERAATAAGAVLTQLVMVSVVVALAATTAARGHGEPLETVGAISAALRPLLGTTGAKLLFGTGMLGAALVASLVAALAAAWSLADLAGWRPASARKATGFRAVFAALLIVAGATILTGVNLVRLAVAIEALNAALLPVLLGFLLALEATALPRPARRGQRGYRYLTWAVSITAIAFAGIVAWTA